MKTVILGGPALALDNSIPTRHYTIIDVEDSSQIASIVIDQEAKTRSIIIHKSDYSEKYTSAVCRFLKSVFPTYTTPFTADDGNAVSLAYMLSGNIASNDPDIVAAWSMFEFALEMRHENKSGLITKVRFTGANMKGIKDISTATSITLTVTTKAK